MRQAVQPAVLNFKGKEAAARTQHATDFVEGAILQCAGFQVVQRENGDDTRKGAIREGQGCGIGLHGSGASTDPLRQASRGAVVVFQTGDAGRAAQQLAGGGSGAGADFEDVLP